MSSELARIEELLESEYGPHWPAMAAVLSETVNRREASDMPCWRCRGPVSPQRHSVIYVGGRARWLCARCVADDLAWALNGPRRPGEAGR